MKRFSRAFIVATFMLTTFAAHAASPEDNIKVVQKFFAAYGANDLNGIAEVMHENVQWHIPGRHPLSGTKSGRREVLAFFAALGRAGFKAEPIYFGADDKFVVDIHRGWSNADGKTNVDTVWALLYRIENGKNCRGDQS